MRHDPNISGMAGQMDGLAADSGKARKRRILIAAGVVLVVIAALLLWNVLRGGSPSTAIAPVGNIPNVTVILVKPGAISRTVSGTGVVAARRDMPVGVVGEGGSVARVLVEPGDRVAAGQVLLTIDRSVQRQQASALAAQIEVARANAKLADANLTRARALVGNGFISKADLDNRIANRDAAAAQVNVAVAQLNQIRAAIARLDVRAPAAGIVLTRAVEPGQVVSGSSGVLFRMAYNGEMEMRLALNEADMAGVEVGDRATVTPVGAPAPVRGTVWQVSPVVDTQSRQGTVRILLDPAPDLRPGAFANATVTTGSDAAGVRLPESAVQSDDRGTFVFVVDARDRIVRRPVTTGTVTDEGIVISQGLNGQERIVATAGGFLAAGDKVKPVAGGTR